VYMCVELPPGDLNPNLCLLHLTSIYTCGVTTAHHHRIKGARWLLKQF